MNGVIGFADVLGQTQLDSEQRRYVQRISQSGETMTQLLNDILDFARMEAGSLRIAREPFDLHALCRDTIGQFEGLPIKKDVKWQCFIAPDVPQWVEGDMLRLRQVLTNMLGNASKFTEAGEIALRVSTQNGMVQIDVDDTGIGIADVHLTRIFNNFEQIDEATTRKHDGAGLGLAIVAELVRLMDGKITVSSAIGVGSRFSISIPLPQIEAHAGQATSAEPSLNRR